MLAIPVIDFGRFIAGGEEGRRAVGEQIIRGYNQVGFLYLKNHGINEELLARVFEQSKAFFALPYEKKMESKYISPEANRGYSPPGSEKLGQSLDKNEIEKLRETSEDLKESIEIGFDQHPVWKNPWPQHNPNFKSVMNEFFNECDALQLTIMSALATGLGLHRDFFRPLCDGKDNNLRLLHYPPVKSQFMHQPGQKRANEHTDYGSITLLFQDDTGGLEVQLPSGEFIPAPPIEGTVIINAGDLLERWTNNKIKSTMHRVVSPSVPSTDGQYSARYSVVYFCSPNYDALIDVLDICLAEGETKKFPPILSGDYLVQRLSATY
ncbi:hypothetical protein BJ742DRAFT_258635 [Cladochytrium replicatum]|nr:hypothetical protein BJ742DRAFT_258635 [Cladochytrium replicatum]